VTSAKVRADPGVGLGDMRLRLVHPNNMTFSQHFPLGKFDVLYCLIAYIELFYQTNNTRLLSVLSVDLKQSCLNNVFFLHFF
jgi:hypothetical protein